FPISGTSGTPPVDMCRDFALSTARLGAKWICRLGDVGGGRILPSRPGGRKLPVRPLWVTDHSPWSAHVAAGTHHPVKCGQTSNHGDGVDRGPDREGRVSRGEAGRGSGSDRVGGLRPPRRSAQVGGERPAGADRGDAEEGGDGGAEGGEGGAAARVGAAGAAGAEGDHGGELAGVVGAGSGGVAAVVGGQEQPVLVPQF